MPMWGWSGNWGWWMPFHGVLSLLFLILVIVGISVVVRSVVAGGSSRDRSRSAALETLKERYAKGEIQREEYLQKKHDIGG